MNFLKGNRMYNEERWVLLEDDSRVVQIGMTYEYAMGFMNFIDSIYLGYKQYSIKFDEYYEYHELPNNN